MIDWSPLRTALARCRATKTPLPIWWRDDDAIEPTASLDRLSDLSQELGVAVYLATISKLAEDALVPYANDRPHIIPCVHGWEHVDHSSAGAKKSEFGTERDSGALELGQAIRRMQLMFSDDMIALFVPPWNRFDPRYLPALVQNGYLGISTFGPRASMSRLPEINTHVDPIFWKGHRGLVDPSTIITQTVEILEARRQGVQDPTEPLGLLTHHLVHTPEVWEFSKAFIAEMLDGGAYPANLKEILT